MTGTRARALRLQWDMLVTLALADLRDRFGRGPARVVKWLVDPFAVAGVYLVFVAFIVDRGGETPGLTVACAVVPFQLLITTAIGSMRSVLEQRSLILNLGFRRQLLPAAVTITETLGFAASFTLLAIMMAAYGVAPTPAAWELLYPAGFGLALLAIFVPLFRSEQRHLAKVA